MKLKLRLLRWLYRFARKKFCPLPEVVSGVTSTTFLGLGL